jgi:hypothetical protein
MRTHFTLFFFAVSLFAKCEELPESHAKAIKSLEIEKNFKGFSYIIGESKDLSIKLLPGALDDKKLNGIILVLGDDGEIRAIRPSFDDTDLAFEPISWAFDKFHQKMIGIDSLWEIVRATQPKNIDDLKLISFIISSLETSVSQQKLNQIHFSPNGPLSLSIKNHSKPPQNSKQFIRHDLSEVKEFLQGRNNRSKVNTPEE